MTRPPTKQLSPEIAAPSPVSEMLTPSEIQSLRQEAEADLEYLRKRRLARKEAMKKAELDHRKIET